MQSVTLTYVDSQDVQRVKKLEGKKVGYHLEKENHWTIWADEITFGIPLSRVVHVEVDKSGGEEE